MEEPNHYKGKQKKKLSLSRLLIEKLSTRGGGKRRINKRLGSYQYLIFYLILSIRLPTT